MGRMDGDRGESATHDAVCGLGRTWRREAGRQQYHRGHETLLVVSVYLDTGYLE